MYKGLIDLFFELRPKFNFGVEKERVPAIYGAKVLKNEGDEVEPGEAIIEWDPFAIPLLAEVSGTVKFRDNDKLIVVSKFQFLGMPFILS